MTRCLIPLALFVSVTLTQPADSLLKSTFPLTQKLLHKPPFPFFKGRPYYLELFVDLPKDSLESVSLFFKTENSVKYQEMPLEKYRGRLRFKYDPKTTPGEKLSYFFIAIVKNGGIYATPLDKNGKLKPITVNPVDPVKYYESAFPKR